jgi:NAD(P)H-flavin reductase
VSAHARFLVELVARAALSPRVNLLRFRVRDHAPFNWAAGQYLELIGTDPRRTRLPYSIASARDGAHPDEFEVAPARDSSAVELEHLALGATLHAEGPSGHFVWQPSPSPVALLVGAGTGVAPLRALIQAELARPSSTELVLLAGHRGESEVLWKDEFEALARRIERFRFEPTLSAPAPSWPGRSGRVQEHLPELVHELGVLDLYVCGRIEMVDDVRRVLAELGVDVARVRYEGH